MLCLAGCVAPGPTFEQEVEAFSARLNDIMTTLEIPAISVMMMKGDDIVLARGYGYADLEGEVTADANTIFHLASVTKPFAAILILQLEQESRLSVEDPASAYGVDLDSTILIKHLLSHTSEGEPGSYFNYNGGRFGQLTGIIEEVTGNSFAQELTKRILEPLEMRSTVPSVRDTLSFEQRGIPMDQIRPHLASPYQVNDEGQVNKTELESYFGASAGLMSTVSDLALFSSALDTEALLRLEKRQKMWTPMVNHKGEILPYALGWFVQELDGKQVIWHYGYWWTNSSLFVKVPALDLSFIILANTDRLSAASPMIGSGDLLKSIVGREFLRRFVLEAEIPDINYDRPFIELYGFFNEQKNSDTPDFYHDDLFLQANLHGLLNNDEDANLLWTTYNAVYLKPSPVFLEEGDIIALIDSVGNDVHDEQAFSIDEVDEFRIYAVGEGMPGSDMWDYAWLATAANDTLWIMTADESTEAGGDAKNRLADTALVLDHGEYILGYHSDNSHAFNTWNTLPPRRVFYGVGIIRQ